MFAHGNGAGKQCCWIYQNGVFFAKIWASPAKRAGAVVSGTRADEKSHIFWDVVHFTQNTQ